MKHKNLAIIAILLVFCATLLGVFFGGGETADAAVTTGTSLFTSSVGSTTVTSTPQAQGILITYKTSAEESAVLYRHNLDMNYFGIKIKVNSKHFESFYVELTDDTDSSISAADKVKRTGVEKYELVEKAASQDDRVKVFTDVLGASEQSSISKSALSGKEAVEKWFFSDDRKEGDFDKVPVTTGTDTKVTKSYAVLFLGVNEENWLISAKSSVASERLQTWYNGMKESCHLTMDYEQATAAETTGAATTVTGGTSAATEPASETATEAVSEGESVTGTETATEPAESETAA